MRVAYTNLREAFAQVRVGLILCLKEKQTSPTCSSITIPQKHCSFLSLSVRLKLRKGRVS